MVANNVLMSKFIPIYKWWLQCEVPQDFRNDLEPPFAYMGMRILNDHRSGWLKVVFMAHVAEIAMYWLSEAWNE